jgi:hypothetical protein
MKSRLSQVKTALSGHFAAMGRRPDTAQASAAFRRKLIAEVISALTLGAMCHAYGVDLSLAELLLVNTAASAFAGLMPEGLRLGASAS